MENSAQEDATVSGDGFDGSLPDLPQFQAEPATDDPSWMRVAQVPFHLSDAPFQAIRPTIYPEHASTSLDPPSNPPSLLSAAPYRPGPAQPGSSLSTSNVPVIAVAEQTPLSPTFEPPARSIFSSGPPTASVSASTAQASLSSANPSSSFRPLASLTAANPSRRNTPRSVDMQSPIPSLVSPARHSIAVSEKDADDPSSSSAAAPDMAQVNTSTTLSKLFAVSEAATPAYMSRGASHLRSLSGMARTSDDTATLHGHLLHRGFMDGRHSDITVHVLERSYRLHKLLLDRVPFFASAFSGSWAESSAKELTLHPEDIDPNITRSAFELALKKVYGADLPQQEDHEAIGLFATGCWLDMTDIVDAAVDALLRQMKPSKLHVLIKLVTNNYYGKAGDRILSSAKAMLCREGWEMPFEYWDHIPAEIIREIIGGDPFYVPGEWERWYLTLKLLNRRLKGKAIGAGLVSAEGRYLHPKPSSLRFFAVRFDTTYRRDGGLGAGRYISDKDDAWISLYTLPEISPLLVLLDEGIHYVHLHFEQLQQIRTQKDILGVPVLPEKVISGALWMSMELRQRVLNAHESDLELGLSEEAEEYPDTEAVESCRSSSKDKRPAYAVLDSNDMESGSWDGNGKPRKFWIPNNDVSCVMGGVREACLAANSATGAEWTSHASRLSASLELSDVAWAADFTGSLAEAQGQMPRSISTQQQYRYSHYPPFRFSVEFPNPRTLREKKRVYSQTVWYAGSMWNLYIQRVNTSKNQQLGIYLHRAKDKDPSDDPLAQFIPASVDDRIGQLEREMLLRKTERRRRHYRSDVTASGGEADREDESSGSGAEFDGAEPESSTQMSGSASTVRPSDSTARAHKTSQIPSSKTERPTPTSAAEGDEVMNSDDENEHLARACRRFSVSAMPPYADGRPTIKTYFKIYSPSKAGRLLSIYESAPDRFNFSQSWGWKSSQMVLDDGMNGYDVTKGAKDGKLRYMVVLGNV